MDRQRLGSIAHSHHAIAAPVHGVTEGAIDDVGHPDSAAALNLARDHRDARLRGYRNVLGFATLVLRRMPAA